MKTLFSLLAVMLLSAGYASAQDVNSVNTSSTHSSGSSDITGFRSSTYSSKGANGVKPAPNPNVVLKPKTGGVFVDGVKEGWVIISPGAPAAYGMGEKYLSAPSTRADLQHESAYAAHWDAGGIKLFTFEF